ncbi:IPT/TIG domain-containing protein [Patescibacteria group bacterium]
MALSKSGNKLLVVDRNNNRIKEVVISTGEMRYLTGAGKKNVVGSERNGFKNGGACPNEWDTGVSGCAYFSRPTGSVLSKSGKFLYVADSGNNRIRRVTVYGPNKGKVKTIAGSGDAGFANGVGSVAKFNAPMGLTRSATGRVLYVADRDNHRIRKVNVRTGKVTTYAGTGDNGYLDAKLKSAQLSYPEWITRGRDGNLYFSEVGSHRIRMIERSAGVTKLVSGSGERGFHNGSRAAAEFNNPRGLLALKNKLLVAELYNDQIRSINIKGETPYTDPAPDVTAVSPSLIGKEWFAGATASVEFRGSNFRHGATAYVGPFEATNTYVNSDSVIVVEMPIAQMSAGYYTVRVQNVDGQKDDLIRGLSITQGGLIPDNDYWP